jgi:hypothetical protein
VSIVSYYFKGKAVSNVFYIADINMLAKGNKFCPNGHVMEALQQCTEGGTSFDEIKEKKEKKD